MDQAELKVYRSSAGSGKTFTLVKEFLTLCFKSGRPDYFRHILAITFTVKAAREMKERILFHLEEFSNGNISTKSKGMLEALCRETGLEERKVLELSGPLFTNMLHRYGDISVMTIDRFVHRVIRGFAYELQLSHDFQIELDVDRVIRKSVETLFESVGEEPYISKLLVDFIVQKSEEDKSWKIDNELRNLLKQMLTEEFQLSTEVLSQRPASDLYDTIKKLDEERKAFENLLSNLGKEGMRLVEDAEINPESFAGGSNGGICKFLSYLIDRNFQKFRPTPTLSQRISDGKWHAAKAYPDQIHAIDSIKDKLESIFNEICVHLDRDYERQTILRLVRSTIFAYGTAAELNLILERIKTEENILLISEFNEKIAKVTLQEDIPFIYERIGNKYRNFLIDEFQDTSSLQWQNLLPLVENGLSMDHSSLIVGDAKQSIYRFRGSEPEQLIRLPEPISSMSSPQTLSRLQIIKRNYRPYNLQANFRSSKTIVGFNNRFFEALSLKMLDSNYVEVYGQLAQQPFSNRDGHVSLRFYDTPNQQFLEGRFLDECIAIIYGCKQRGHNLKDIAVLCRANSTASKLASEFILKGIPVISQESLLLKSVPQIKLILAIIQCFRYNKDVFYASQIFFGLCHCGIINSDQLTAFCLQLKKEENEFSFETAFREIGLDIDIDSTRIKSIFKVVSGLVGQLGFQKDDPFILKFLDFAFEYDEDIKLVGTSFIDHWAEHCNNLSIEMQEGVDAVQVMTIHKSKGLEFPVVIYPGINFHHKPTREQVWARVEHYMPDLPHTLLPVQKALEGTLLESIYTTEMAKSKLDQLNIAYVACTRAVSELYVLGRAKDGKPACKELEFLADWEEWEDERLTIGQPTVVASKPTGGKQTNPLTLS